MCLAGPVSTEPLAGLTVAYTDVAAIAVSLSEAESWRATGCPGWAVRDVIFHLLGDAQRALVALATPAPADGSSSADRDSVTYWIDAPGAPDPDSRGLRAVRTMASAWRLDHLVATYAETAHAVLALAARTPLDGLVATQGHVLRVSDFLDTLTVEAVLHQLDLLRELDRPAPDGRALAVVRATVDGLLGRPGPVAGDGLTWIRIATGRQPLTAQDRAALGADAERMPLLS